MDTIDSDATSQSNSRTRMHGSPLATSSLAAPFNLALPSPRPLQENHARLGLSSQASSPCSFISAVTSFDDTSYESRTRSGTRKTKDLGRSHRSGVRGMHGRGNGEMEECELTSCSMANSSFRSGSSFQSSIENTNVNYDEKSSNVHQPITLTASGTGSGKGVQRATASPLRPESASRHAPASSSSIRTPIEVLAVETAETVETMSSSNRVDTARSLPLVSNHEQTTGIGKDIIIHRKLTQDPTQAHCVNHSEDKRGHRGQCPWSPSSIEKEQTNEHVPNPNLEQREQLEKNRQPRVRQTTAPIVDIPTTVFTIPCTTPTTLAAMITCSSKLSKTDPAVASASAWPTTG
ncbi:hypothetical protein BGW38_003430, partial [Lunasporangiospora selenospora]